MKIMLSKKNTTTISRKKIGLSLLIGLFLISISVNAQSILSKTDFSSEEAQDYVIKYFKVTSNLFLCARLSSFVVK